MRWDDDVWRSYGYGFVLVVCGDVVVAVYVVLLLMCNGSMYGIGSGVCGGGGGLIHGGDNDGGTGNFGTSL